MARTRRIQGEIVFPPDAVRRVAARIAVELRDVSMQDQPSVLLAETSLENVPVGPGIRVPFAFEAPSVATERSLSLRVQVDMQANSRSAAGDYLTTTSHPVPADGDATGLVVPVTRL
jgi:uncharacterized lipoprotein YbaY